MASTITCLNNTNQITRSDGNTLYSYNDTYVTGPSPNYWVSAQTSIYSRNSSTIYNLTDYSPVGGTVERSFTTTLYVVPTYYLGTYQLAETYWSYSPYCESLGYSYTYEYWNKSSSYVALKPTVSVTGAPGYSSWAVWYLGGAPSIDGYYSVVAMTGNSQWGTGTSPITWSASLGGSKVNISPSTGASTLVTALAPSSAGTFDVNIQISTDGLPSDPFPLYLDTPYSASTALAFQQDYTGPPLPSPIGYESIFSYAPIDLTGYNLVPITSHETWENRQFDIASPVPTWGIPATSTAYPSFWDGNLFYDSLAAWQAGQSPSPSASGAGTVTVENLTQKWWVGTATSSPTTNTFTGECIRENKAQYYVDHATLPVQITPSSNAVCASGNFAN